MAENTKKPAIRFAGFTEAWEQRKLSEIATMHARIGWQNLRTSEFLDSGDYMLITGTDFMDGAVIFNNCHYVERERYEQDKHIQIRNGSILITKDGTLGKVAYIQGLTIPATLNAGVFNVEIKNEKEVDNRYLFQYLKAPFLMDYVDKKATGGTIKHLNQNILVDFPVVLPKKVEQEKIGEYFLAIDNLITLHQRKYDKLTNAKKSMLEKMFPKNGSNVPEIRFKGFTEAWEQRKVNEICYISTGRSNTQDKIDDGKYPFYVRSPIIERSNRYLYDEEAVLTVGDGVGTGKVFHYVNGKYDIHQRVYRLFGFSDDVDAKFFYHWFSENFYNRVMSMTAKTSVDSVRLEMIADMEMTAPPYDEQKKISSYLDHLDHLITLHQRKLEKLKNIKKSMLEKMFI